jgi:hypothetical protein
VSARARRRALLAVGAVLVVGTVFFPYDRLIDDGFRPVRLKFVRAGVYQTSGEDEPTRVFYMNGCTAPTGDTRVVVKKGPVFGRLQMADVRFPTGERCSAAIVFATRAEDRGVVRTSSARDAAQGLDLPRQPLV